MDIEKELLLINAKLYSYYKKKAEIQAGMLITDSIIKLSIPVIISIVLSIFILSPFTTNISDDMNIGNSNPLYFWGIVLLIVIIWLFGLSYIRRIELSTSGFTTDIEIIRFENRFNELREEAEAFKKQRETRELDEKKQNEERIKKEQQKKLEREKQEFEVISFLDKIIYGLENEDEIELQTESHRFRRLCFDESIHMTDNPEIINRMKTCIVKIFTLSYTGALEHLIAGFHDLVIESPKCTYYNMAKDEFYQEIKTIINNENNYEHVYMESMYQIFCNIAKLEDIESMFMPHKAIKDKTKIANFNYNTRESLFLINYKEELIRKIVDILKKQEKYNKRNMEDLRDMVIEQDIESAKRANKIPRCKRK